MFIHYDVPRSWGKTREIINNLEREDNSYCLVVNSSMKRVFNDVLKYHSKDAIKDRIFSMSELTKLFSKIRKEGITTLYIDEYHYIDPKNTMTMEWELETKDDLLELLLQNGVNSIRTYSTSRGMERAQRKAYEKTGKYALTTKEIINVIKTQ